MRNIGLIIFVIAVLVIFSFAVYIYSTNSDIKEFFKIEKEGDVTDEDSEESDNFDELGAIKGGVAGDSSEEDGGIENPKENGNSGAEEPQEELPDFESSSCGIYFADYGVCSGTCPSGTCVSEGRSCYCKE